MYNTLSKCIDKPRKVFNIFIQTRYLSAKEISTALRQFYFNVHPDLFGKYPEQRAINENSLKQLSSYIETVRTYKPFQPCTIEFYLKETKQSDIVKFRLVKIPLMDTNVRNTIINILKSCDLSTEYIDTIPIGKEPSRPQPGIPFYEQQQYPFEFDMDNIIRAKQRVREEPKIVTLKNFIKDNYKTALEKYGEAAALKKDIENIRNEIYEKFGPEDIRWDCGWNELHFRGCLKSFKELANDHPETLKILKNRVLIFGPFTGVNLDGHIVLNRGEVRHNWLKFLQNIEKYDVSLLRIPFFEKAVSQCLRDIQIVRRKFMPKIQAEDYEKDLLVLMTSLNDYRGKKSYPKVWPESLKNYELVVETASGPLMVSPTGQFIVPSSCPSFLLITFITENLEAAAKKIIDYNAHKHIEIFLHAMCLKELKLADLQKDDNVTPDLMIKCCEMLLEHKSELESLENLHLHISTYYSLLHDGVMCIPWNFKI